MPQRQKATESSRTKSDLADDTQWLIITIMHFCLYCVYVCVCAFFFFFSPPLSFAFPPLACLELGGNIRLGFRTAQMQWLYAQ